MLTVGKTIKLLGLSFGGHSQYPTSTIGAALAGQHNNATPWPFRQGQFRDRLNEAAEILADYWDEPDPEDILSEIERGYVLACLDFDRAELLGDWE